MAKPGRGSDQFPLRLPPGMRDQIKRIAEENGRSMNSEILDVLREYFPEEPSLEELIDEFGYAVAMLKEIQANSPDGDVRANKKYLTVLGNMIAANEHLSKADQSGRSSPIVRLRPEVIEGMVALQQEWEFPQAMMDDLASNLIQMSLDRIASGEENLKSYYPDGETLITMELKRPASNENDK